MDWANRSTLDEVFLAFCVVGGDAFVENSCHCDACGCYGKQLPKSRWLSSSRSLSSMLWPLEKAWVSSPPAAEGVSRRAAAGVSSGASPTTDPGFWGPLRHFWLVDGWAEAAMTLPVCPPGGRACRHPPIEEEEVVGGPSRLETFANQVWSPRAYL